MAWPLERAPTYTLARIYTKECKTYIQGVRGFILYPKIYPGRWARI